MSNARVLLPDPETPVITTRLFLGIVTSMFLRLCSLAPLTTILSSGLAPICEFEGGPLLLRFFLDELWLGLAISVLKLPVLA